MKIRNGLVSNSSSSSFIIAIAKIVDEVKAKAWLKTLNLKKWECNIKKISDIPPYDDNNYYSLFTKDNKIMISSFMKDIYLDAKDIKADDKIIYVNISNNEGDCGRFSGCDENGEYRGIDYDIDLDYFPDNQQALYKGLCEENGFTNVAKEYGAGRDG